MKLKNFHLNVENLNIDRIDKGFKLYGRCEDSYKWDKSNNKYVPTNKENIEYEFNYSYSISNGVLLTPSQWDLEKEDVDKSLNKYIQGIYRALNMKYSRKEYFTERNKTKKSDIFNFEKTENVSIFKFGKNIFIIPNLNIDLIIKSNNLAQKEKTLNFNLKFKVLEEVQKEDLVFIPNKSILSVDGVLAIKLRNQYFSNIKKNKAMLYSISDGEQIVLSDDSKILRLS